MRASVSKKRLIAALATAAVASAWPALAEDGGASFSGDYVCNYGCRLTDAAPRIEVNGADATCWNEFGGVFHGRLLSGNLLFCFNKLGALSEDGTTIRWDGGVIWRRLPARAR